MFNLSQPQSGKGLDIVKVTESSWNIITYTQQNDLCSIYISRFCRVFFFKFLNVGHTAGVIH